MAKNPDFDEFSKFLTDNARMSLAHAGTIARGLGNAYIGTEHLLLGLIAQDGSLGGKILEESGVSLSKAQIALKMQPQNIVQNLGAKGYSETAKLTLRMAYERAQDYGQDYCGTEHILYSILTQKNARATVMLREMGVNVDVVQRELENFLNRQFDDAELNEGASSSRSRGKRGTKQKSSAEPRSHHSKPAEQTSERSVHAIARRRG